jgi:TRAP-type C4-dicarboxylate transport system substrate-binding protein
MNAKKWDSLPKHIQEVFMEALRLEVIVIDARTSDDISNEYKEMKKAGMAVTEFSPADTKKYLDMAYTISRHGLYGRVEGPAQDGV